jgi:predicted MFS family arabinose efflux permease
MKFLKRLFYYLVERRDYLATWFCAISAGSFVGGVMFNTFGAGNDWRLAGSALVLCLILIITGLLFKGGKEWKAY